MWGHRAIDPGMLYWQPGDFKVPSMATCMQRAGRGIAAVKHEALEDAREVIRLVRLKFGVALQ